MRPRTTAQIFEQFRMDALVRFVEACDSGNLANIRCAGDAFIELLYATAQALAQEQRAA